MSLKQKWVFMLVLMPLCCLGRGIEASVERESADSLYQAAVEQVGRVPVKESIRAFRRVLKVDQRYTPVYYEIAKLYMTLNTLTHRDQARFALDRAIRLDLDNEIYRLALADLMWAQGFWSNAKEQYEKILEVHPENAEATYGIGYYFLKEFMKYDDMIHAEAGVVLEWKHFAEEYCKKAIFYLERSIALDPGLCDAYYQLGLIYLEIKKPAELVRISRQLLKQFPNDKNALLFCGLGYQTIGMYQEAYEFYTEALNRMDSAERMMMESVDLITAQEEPGQIAQADTRSQEGGSIKEWIDSPEYALVWNKQDPLFLTEFNERKMEHYSRVAYANLRFSRPSKGVDGWQTDMGKTYIKFGKSIHQVAKRPHIVFGGTGIIIHPHLETWFYEGFKVTFLNWDGLDNWSFAPAKNFTARTPRMHDYDNPDPLDPEPSPVHIFNHTPARYVDPYRKQKYTLPYQVAAFQDENGPRLEISYAILKSKLDITKDMKLEKGTFLFNENWKEVHKDVTQSFKLEIAGSDSFKNQYLISQYTTHIEPSRYHIVAEFYDGSTGSIGTFRTLHIVPDRDTLLAMSDIILSSQIETRTPFPDGRNDLNIKPNPLRTYHRLQPIFIYLEVYNLTRDTYGQTEYEISYQVGWPEKEEIDPVLFAAQDILEAQAYVQIETVFQGDRPVPGEKIKDAGSSVDYRVTYVLPEKNQISSQLKEVDRISRRTETSVTVRYKGDRKDDFTYLKIDLDQIPAGFHKLTVTVKDVLTGQTTGRDVLFRVIE